MNTQKYDFDAVTKFKRKASKQFKNTLGFDEVEDLKEINDIIFFRLLRSITFWKNKCAMHKDKNDMKFNISEGKMISAATKVKIIMSIVKGDHSKLHEHEFNGQNYISYIE